MSDQKIELPIGFSNVMVTYEKTFSSGAYGDTKTKQVVTKMGFYDNIDNKFSIPPRWKKFNGVLLPDGWGGDHLTIDKIISWKYCEEINK